MRLNNDGSITMMCTSCFNLINIKGLNIPEGNSEIGLTIDIDATLDHCPHCDKDRSRLCVAIDEELVHEIAVLNKKGYETDYCCASHSEFDPFFYISFRDKTLFETINPPEHFYFDDDGDESISLRIHPSHVLKSYKRIHHQVYGDIMTDVENLDHDIWENRHKIHMELFKEWVKDLPPVLVDSEITPINYTVIDLANI